VTDSVRDELQMPDDKPPAFANAIMRWAVKTPWIERWVGQGVAILTFSGRRTGTLYEIPVSYHRDGDEVTIVTKRLRRWWHNFEKPHEVVLRLAGHDYVGKAEVETDMADASEFMLGYLHSRPIDAKAYGLAKDEITKEHIERIIPGIVVIRVVITPDGQEVSDQRVQQTGVEAMEVSVGEIVEEAARL
jgi:hypothetical protein